MCNNFKVLSIFAFTLVICTSISSAEMIVSEGSQSRQNGYEIFVGKGSSLFFVLQTTGDWMYTINYCHHHKFVPGRISTQEDFTLVSNFILSNKLPQPNQSIWLPATDFETEGTFRWLDHFDDVTVGNWSVGMPSRNRSLNCLKINENGLYEEVSCSWSANPHYALCAVEYMHHTSNSHSEDVTSVVEPKKELNPVRKNIQGWRLIGGVGGKLYYAEDAAVAEHTWLGAIDICHENEMRIVTPETVEEMMFLNNFSKEESGAGRDPTFHIGASDIMSMSCLRGNTKFRWFLTGQDITSDQDLDNYGNHHWYKCAFLTPSGLLASDCLSGATFGTICEVGETSEPVCQPGQYFAPHEDCRFFYICNDDSPDLRQCPNGLYWNQELTACDFPANVEQCLGGTRSPIADIF